MNKISAIVCVAIALKLQKDVNGIIPGIEENLFRDLNEKFQQTVNKVFTILKLGEKFASERHIKILIAIHDKIKSVAEQNYRIYKEIRKKAKCQRDLLKPSLFNFSKPLKELARDGFIFNQTKVYLNQSILKINTTSLEIPEYSEGSIKVLKDYLNKNNATLPIEDLIDKISNTDRMPSRRRNLKAWKPTNITIEQNRRVFQGRSMRIKKFPFVTSIHVAGEYVCVGSIISREMVITAASCVQIAYDDQKHLRNNPWDVAIRVGSDYADKAGDWVYASNIFFHPDYEPETLRNNLALLSFKNFLNLKQKNRKVRRIEYQSVEGKVQLPEELREITLIGFGDKEVESSDEMVQLTSARLTLYDIDNCAEVYTRKYVADKNFCAGFVTKTSGACQRDVGGPAIVGSILVGVVSFGPPVCGTPDAPTVFTNLKHYINWINQIVTENRQQSTPTSDNTSKTTTYHPIVRNMSRTWNLILRKPSSQYDEIDQIEAPERPSQRINPEFMAVDDYERNTQSLPDERMDPLTTRQSNYDYNINQNPEYNTQNPEYNTQNPEYNTQNPEYNTQNPEYNTDYPVRVLRTEKPKTFEFLTNLLRQFIGDYYYNDLYESTTNGLWRPTTTDPNKHPLLNQSLFLMDDVVSVDDAPMSSTLGVVENATTTATKRRNRTREPDWEIESRETTESLFDMMKTVRNAADELPPLPRKNEKKQQGSDYYDSSGEHGMSIEVNPQQVQEIHYYKPLNTIPPITPPKNLLMDVVNNQFFPKDFIPQQTTTRRRIDFERLEKKAEKFLEKNFKKDYKLQKEDKSSEFVLLLLTQSTTTRRRIRYVRDPPPLAVVDTGPRFTTTTMYVPGMGYVPQDMKMDYGRHVPQQDMKMDYGRHVPQQDIKMDYGRLDDRVPEYNPDPAPAPGPGPEYSTPPGPEYTPEYTPEYAPENKQEYKPEYAPEYTPEYTTNYNPEYSKDFNPENAKEPNPEGTTDVAQQKPPPTQYSRRPRTLSRLVDLNKYEPDDQDPGQNGTVTPRERWPCEPARTGNPNIGRLVHVKRSRKQPFRPYKRRRPIQFPEYSHASVYHRPPQKQFYDYPHVSDYQTFFRANSSDGSASKEIGTLTAEDLDFRESDTSNPSALNIDFNPVVTNVSVEIASALNSSTTLPDDEVLEDKLKEFISNQTEETESGLQFQPQEIENARRYKKITL